MPDASKAEALRSGLRTVCKLLAGTAILAIGVMGLLSARSLTAKAATLRAYTIAGGSMSPTFAAGDKVCAELESSPKPSRGDVWVFRFPRSSSLPGVGIKRVVGLPGDQVEVKLGTLWINGEAVDEPYVSLPFTYSSPALTLGQDEHYLLGDDRDSSSDSHIWGIVPRDHLIGKVRYRVWPLTKLGQVE